MNVTVLERGGFTNIGTKCTSLASNIKTTKNPKIWKSNYNGKVIEDPKFDESLELKARRENAQRAIQWAQNRAQESSFKKNSKTL